MKDFLQLLSPYELLHVFYYLNAHDLKSTKLVCKTLYYNEQEIMNIAFRNICLMRWNENEDKILKVLGAGDSWEHLYSLLIWKKRVPKGIYTQTKNTTVFGHGRQNGCEGWILITHTPNTRLSQHTISPTNHYRSIGIKLCLQNTRNDLLFFYLDNISIDLLLLNNSANNNTIDSSLTTINKNSSAYTLKAQNVQVIARNGVKLSSHVVSDTRHQRFSSSLSQSSKSCNSSNFNNNNSSNHLSIFSRHKMRKSSHHHRHKSTLMKPTLMSANTDTDDCICNDSMIIKLRQYEFIVLSFEFHLPTSSPPQAPPTTTATVTQVMTPPQYQPSLVYFDDVEHESDFLSIAKCIQLKHMYVKCFPSSHSFVASSSSSSSSQKHRHNYSHNDSQNTSLSLSPPSPSSSSSSLLLLNKMDDAEGEIIINKQQGVYSSTATTECSLLFQQEKEEEEVHEESCCCSLECCFLEEDDVWKHYIELPGNVVLLRRDCDANISSRF